MYRQGMIGDFLNSAELDEAFQNRKLNFQVFDPFARKSRQSPDFKQYVSIRSILVFPTVSLIYIGLAVLSVVIASLLYFVPPQPQGASTPSHAPSQSAPASIPANP